MFFVKSRSWKRSLTVPSRSFSYSHCERHTIVQCRLSTMAFTKQTRSPLILLLVTLLASTTRHVVLGRMQVLSAGEHPGRAGRSHPRVQSDRPVRRGNLRQRDV